MEDIKQIFGARLRSAREEAGLSAETLAERLSVHPNTVYRLERAEMWISAELLTSIVNVLHIAPAALFGDPPQPTDQQILAAITRRFGKKENETVMNQEGIQALLEGEAIGAERLQDSVSKKSENLAKTANKGKHK